MAILSDSTIKEKITNEEIIIDPIPDEKQFQPSSVDLKLDYLFTKYKEYEIGTIDTRNRYLNLERYSETIKLDYRTDPFVIQPNQFILAQTIEKVIIPDNLVGVVEGRSSFGRLGLLVHSTAGFIDPGFEGKITLELKNINTIPIAIYPEQRICQIVFHEMDKESFNIYGSSGLGSKYQFQEIPTVSKINKD